MNDGCYAALRGVGCSVGHRYSAACLIVLLAFGLASLRSYGETRKYIMYVSDNGKIKIKRYRPRNSVGRW